VLNVAHAKAGDWPARGVAAIPPAALVLSVELLVMIVRRAAIARTTRLAALTPISVGETTVVVRGDQATTMVPPVGDLPALEATNRPGDHQTTAPSDRRRTTAAKATSGDTTLGTANGGATYQRVRDLYLGGVTVAAEIARELGISASYAQRTLRRVKADVARQQDTPASGPGRATTPERAEQATSDQPGDHQQPDDRQSSSPERSPADPNTTPDREAREATTRAEATKDGDGDGRATTTTSDRHLALVGPQRDRDHREVER
jgi:hypothetical protein